MKSHTESERKSSPSAILVSKSLLFKVLGQNMKPDAADEFFLAQESFLERCKARG